MSVVAPGNDGVRVSSTFRAVLRFACLTAGIKCVVETGTYDGVGSSSTLGGAMAALKGKLHTIECDEQLVRIAEQNLLPYPVQVHHGLSIADKDLPSYELLEKRCNYAMAEGVPIDGSIPKDVARFYYDEVRGPHKDEGLLRRLILKYNPGLIHLDSAGGIGFDEWKVVKELAEPGLLLAMDDTRHIKHWESKKDALDSGWLLIWESNERSGSTLMRKL